MIKFENVRIQDVEILRDIAIKAFDDDLKKYGLLPPGIESLKWHSSKVENGLYYKIIKDEVIIGAINLYNLGNDHFHLGAIFISPEYQNQGIGSKAFKFIEEKYNWVRKWTLDTPYLNTHNHKFYEKQGYKKTGKIQPDKEIEFFLYLYEKHME